MTSEPAPSETSRHSAGTALGPMDAASDPTVAALPEPERAAVLAAEDCLVKCAFEDAFMDSKFLKQGGRGARTKATCCAAHLRFDNFALRVRNDYICP